MLDFMRTRLLPQDVNNALQTVLYVKIQEIVLSVKQDIGLPEVHASDAQQSDVFRVTKQVFVMTADKEHS